MWKINMEGVVYFFHPLTVNQCKTGKMPVKCQFVSITCLLKFIGLYATVFEKK